MAEQWGSGILWSMLRSIIPWANKTNLGKAGANPSSIGISWAHEGAGSLATGQSSRVQASFGAC